MPCDRVFSRYISISDALTKYPLCNSTDLSIINIISVFEGNETEGYHNSKRTRGKETLLRQQALDRIAEFDELLEDCESNACDILTALANYSNTIHTIIVGYQLHPSRDGTDTTVRRSKKTKGDSRELPNQSPTQVGWSPRSRLSIKFIQTHEVSNEHRLLLL